MNHTRARRALVVGSHDVNREVLRRLLRACGCEAVTAPSADGAEPHLASVDRVFIDLPPHGEGPERVARAIRERGLPVKVAVTTGCPERAALARAAPWRPDAVFTRPIEFHALIAWLRQ
jgi:CheY-like chemotaxis protein